ncbi:MAG: lipase secretion chaperone [Desulfobacterales bacterium]|nr:lipase secretion chaperone [Desulfobacterales bacterium]
MNKKTFIISIIGIVFVVFVLMVVFNQRARLQQPTEMAPHQTTNTKTNTHKSEPVEKNIATQLHEKNSEESKQEYESAYGPLPRSMQGTQVDGKLMVDNNGNLIIDRSILELFEYFLAAQGEESLEIILGRIEEYIKKQLSDPARQKALDILDGYMKYKQRAADLEKDGILAEYGDVPVNLRDLPLLKKVLEQRMALRREHLSKDVVDAFFGLDEKYDMFTLGRMEILQNESLSESEKNVRIEALQKELLPQELIEMRKEALAYNDVHKQVDDMKSKGASPEEVFEVREKAFGKEAAERLANLDKETGEWNQRMNQYKKQRDTIKNAGNLDDTMKKNEIENLRKNLFNESELRRVKALDKLDGVF